MSDDINIMKDSGTREHLVAPVKDQCRLDIRKYSFSHRTINHWNKLCTDCVMASFSTCHLGLPWMTI